MYKLDLIFGTEIDQKEIKKVETQLDALYTKYSKKKKIKLGIGEEDTTKALEKFSKKLDTVSQKTKKYKTETDKATKSTMNFTAQMGEAIKKFAIWSVVTTAYFAAIRATQDMATETIELNSAILELSKVTDLSTLGMRGDHVKRATGVGVQGFMSG